MDLLLPGQDRRVVLELLSRGVIALERIAAACEAFGQPLPMEAQSTVFDCPHPEEARVDMGPDEWICRACRHHHNAEPETVAP